MFFVIFSNRLDIIVSYIKNIHDFAKTSCINIDVKSCNKFSELNELALSSNIDLIFFDFEDNPNFKTDIQNFKNITSNSKIVLIGNDERNAVWGYSCNATDYLITPTHHEDIINCIAKFCKNKIRFESNFIPIKLNSNWVNLKTEQIMYIESVGHYLTFYMNDGNQFKVHSSFKHHSFNISLNPNLIRCHQSYVINLNYVVDFKYNNFQMKDDKIINISRTYQLSAKNAYTKFQVNKYNTESTSIDQRKC